MPARALAHEHIAFALQPTAAKTLLPVTTITKVVTLLPLRKIPSLFFHQPQTMSIRAPLRRTLHVLDFRRPSIVRGFDVLSRLAFEEFLLRYDPYAQSPVPKSSDVASAPPSAFGRDWLLLGTHSPALAGLGSGALQPPCVVVLGLGGKVSKLVDVPLARRDQVPLLRRFSGGGTVVVDGTGTLLTAIISRTWGGGRPDDENVCKPFPREIMDWTAHAVFGPAFESMTKNLPPLSSSSSSSSSFSSSPPPFSLTENDYTLGGVHKVAGNAQCISGPGRGWLHHTSFLWSYSKSNMAYLLLPEKRPAYRSSRPHGDFLVPLSTHYGHAPGGSAYVFEHLRLAVGCEPLSSSSSEGQPAPEAGTGAISPSFKAAYERSVEVDGDAVFERVLSKVGGMEGWRAFVRGESVLDQEGSGGGTLISRSKIVEDGDEEKR